MKLNKLTQEGIVILESKLISKITIPYKIINDAKKSGRLKSLIKLLNKLYAYSINKIKEITSKDIQYSLVIEDEYDNGGIYIGQNRIMLSLDDPRSYKQQKSPTGIIIQPRKYDWTYGDDVEYLGGKQMHYYQYLIMHELGHLLWREILSKQQKIDFIKMIYKDIKLPEYDYGPKWPAVVSPEHDKYYKNRLTKLPSKYSEKDVEEEFCDSLAFTSTGRKPQDNDNAIIIKSLFRTHGK